MKADIDGDEAQRARLPHQRDTAEEVTDQLQEAVQEAGDPGIYTVQVHQNGGGGKPRANLAEMFGNFLLITLQFCELCYE